MQSIDNRLNSGSKLKSENELTGDLKYELLKEISFKMRDTFDLDKILDHIIDTLKKIVNYDAAGIFVLNQDYLTYPHHTAKQAIAGIVRKGYDQNTPVESDEMLMHGKGLVGHVIKTGKSIIVPDVRDSSDYVEARKETRSEIAVPIFIDGKSIGALNLESDEVGCYSEKDLKVLNFFAYASSISIEKAILHSRLLKNKVMESQLKVAKEIQAGLLPKNPPETKDYDIAGSCITTYDIGGDYYDYIQLSKNKIGIVVADISGHGIPAALIMTAFRALIRSHAKSIFYPSGLVSLLDSQISEFIRKRDFITLFYGILDINDHTFSYTNCGHNAPILYRASGHIETLEERGPSLNIVSNARYVTSQITLNPGDQLCIYTDGLVECFNKSLVEFGMEKLIALNNPSLEKSSEETIDKIIETAKEFHQSDYFDDDITIVIIKRKVS